MEYDPSMYPQRVGRQKHLLEIEFHFNDGRRGGGLNRGGRGRPRGPGGAGSGNSGVDRRGNGGPPNRRDRGEQNADADASGEERGKRPPRESRGNEDRRDRRPYVCNFYLLTNGMSSIICIYFYL